jgi:hypothetical protein
MPDADTTNCPYATKPRRDADETITCCRVQGRIWVSAMTKSRCAARCGLKPRCIASPGAASMAARWLRVGR